LRPRDSLQEASQDVMVAGRPNSTWGGGIRVVVADRKTVALITIMLLPKGSAFRQQARAGGVDA
jgi:hypothetical protein